MSAGSTALLILGVLLVIAGIGLIALDYAGKGDTSGIDYKDVGILVVGIVLAALGAALSRRGRATVAPAAAANP